MSISHRTNRLKLVGQPSVEQLQNGRYRLTVNCTTINSREDWYSANKDRIFPDFGSLQSAEMSIDGLAPREGEAYTDMRLTKVESGNRSGMGAVGDYNVELTYETLGSAFVQVKDDTTDYELNGLRRVTRTSIAEVGTDYAKTVGSSFIDHQINNETAVRCYLASYSVDDNDSFRQVQEVYIEPGILSETLDNVGSQKAKVIETIGTDPATPAGYVLANKQESDFEGFQTNRFTFLKPSILSVQQDLNDGEKLVNVQAFDKTSTQVSELLSEVTDSHTLISQSESEYDGIKTSTYVYEINSSYKEEYEVNGFKRITLKELGIAPFTAAAIGSAAPLGSPAAALFLASQRIDNGGVIKVRETVWIEAGVISVSSDNDSITKEVLVNAINLSVAQVRSIVPEVTENHSLSSSKIDDFQGLNSANYVFEIRSTTTATELGDPLIGVEFETGIQTDGSSDFIITRKYSISSANTASSIKKLLPPEITDPVFDGTGGTQKAYIVDQEVKPNGLDGAELTRTFAMVPSKLDEWDEMVVRFPGVERGPFQLDEGFDFRSEPFSESVPVRMCREFFLSNPQRICRPAEFRPVDENGNRVLVLTANTVPTADEYIGYVNSGTYLNDRVSILRWQGDIWERRIVQFKAE